MLAIEIVKNIAVVTDQLRRQTPTAAPPVIAAPQWFIDELAEAYRTKETELGAVPAEVNGIKLVCTDGLDEPVVLDAGGKMHRVAPSWARVKPHD